MENGLYSVQFQTPIGIGNGVIHLRDGEARGGDSSMYYRGTYTLNGDAFTAEIEIDQHSPGQSVLGANKATLNLTGTLTGTQASLKGSSPQAPGLAFQALINKVSE